MLKQRIITAVILIPLIIVAILFLPSYLFAIVLALALALAVWEWARLIGFSNLVEQVIYTALTLFLFWLSWWGNADIIIYFSMMWWLLATFFVIAPSYFLPLWQHSLGSRVVMGLLLFLPMWFATVILQAKRPEGPYYLIYLLVLIWGVDTGAYFSGRLWGKRKLVPHISPNKTVIGLIGGLVMSVVIAIIGIFLFSIPLAIIPWWILLNIITALAAVVGDLFESLCKRGSGVKDSGKLLPGHGGVLDRIDSWLAAIPIFTVGLFWLRIL